MVGRHVTRLAKAYGLQSIYTDGLGQRRRASQESVISTLQALGVPLETAGDAADTHRARTAETWARPVEPVMVAWQESGTFVLRVPSSRSSTGVRCRLRLEDGTTRTWTTTNTGGTVTERAEIDGVAYVAGRHRFPSRLPYGYHELTVTVAGHPHTSLVISAPVRAFDSRSSTWGCFLPLHALHTKESWGIGDFSDLSSLVAWMSSQGGQVVSTLPLLASFLGDAPFEPSPYLPASRLFWNEVFVDPRDIPEFAVCAAARRLVESSVFQKEMGMLRAATLVDHRRVMVAKRQVLELLSQSLARRRGSRHQALERWTRQQPLAEEYAVFRATGERLGQPWSMWPSRVTPQTILDTRPDRAVVRYHLYAQWVAETQLTGVVDQARTVGRGLYLDHPLCVHPESFDVWRYPELFACGASAGAPPDELFANGQNWTAPPPHPETARADRYQYFRAGLVRQLEKAGTLRLDHVMALHRLFWIPRDFDPTDGVYIRYPADELYAIISLESHRHRTPIVGENLGTVPPEVTRAMARHRMATLYVAQFNLNERSARPLRPVRAGVLACINTHDTPMFKGFLDGADIDERLSRGLLVPNEARRLHARRRAVVAALRRLPVPARAGKPVPSTAISLLQRCLEKLARSGASFVVVSLEDLWEETDPQNIPGTTWEHANWQRKARYGLKALARLPQIDETLRLLARGRATAKRRRPAT